MVGDRGNLRSVGRYRCTHLSVGHRNGKPIWDGGSRSLVAVKMSSKVWVTLRYWPLLLGVGFYHEIAVSAEMAKPATPVVRQSTQTDCGLAALATLLNVYQNTQLTLGDVRDRANALALASPLAETQGFSIGELLAIADSYGLGLEPRLVTLNQLTDIAEPVIAWANLQNVGHYTVIDPVSLIANTLRLRDPTLGRTEVPKAWWESQWAGFNGRGLILRVPH